MNKYCVFLLVMDAFDCIFRFFLFMIKNKLNNRTVKPIKTELRGAGTNSVLEDIFLIRYDCVVCFSLGHDIFITKTIFRYIYIVKFR